MPKAGRYEYPARSLDDCIVYLETANKVSNSLVIKRESFGKAVHLSSRGGGFGVLIGSMGMYGLTETGSGDIRFTSLAEKILFGRPDEKKESKNKAVRNVKLFQEIFDKYSTEPSQDQLRHILREKANVAISEEEKTASDVGNSYKKNTEHLTLGVDDSRKIQTKSYTPSGSGLFTVTAAGLTIEVDSLMKIGLVEQLLEDAKTKLQSLKEKKEKESEIKNQNDSVKGSKGVL